MLLNTQQAAEKLGTSTYAVKQLVKSGALQDHAKPKKGATRHFFKLDSREVAEFKKSLQEKEAPRKIIVTPPNGERAPRSTASQIPGVLQRIEAKLDKLLAMWE